MPVVLCPTCHSPLTVHESQSDRVVMCPKCRNPLTVPGVATARPTAPVPEANPFEAWGDPVTRDDEDSLPIRRRRMRGANPVALIGVGLLGLAALIMVVAAVIRGDRVSEENARRTDKQADSGVSAKPDPAGNPITTPATTNKSAQEGTPTVALPAPKKLESIAKTRPKEKAAPKPLLSPPTFDEAMKDATKIAEALDKDEPQKTRKALALLTEFERGEVWYFVERPALELLELPELLHQEFLRRPVQLGFTERAAVLSRHAARKSKDFPAVARKLWEPTTGAAGIVAMMNRWGTVDDFTRQDVVHATTNNTPTAQLFPETRNAILLLGGKTWLLR